MLISKNKTSNQGQWILLLWMLLLIGCQAVSPTQGAIEAAPTGSAPRHPASTVSFTVTRAVATSTVQPTATPTVVIPTPVPDTPTAIGTDNIELIAFSTMRYTENYPVSEIFAIQTDGKNLQNLTNSPDNDKSFRLNVSWYPDGKRLLFIKDRDLYTLNLVDRTQKLLLSEPKNILGPRVSPDGQFILFASDPGDSFEDIFLVRTNGNDLVQLTTDPGSDGTPTWSPDSKHFAFVSDRTGNMEIYVTSVDEMNPINITNNEADDFTPSWSPDGQTIAFNSNREGKNYIYTMNPDGSNLRRLTDFLAYHPDWSPDGKQIVFEKVGEQQGLYIMDKNGQNVRLLYEDSNAMFPAWQPNEKTSRTDD